MQTSARRITRAWAFLVLLTLLSMFAGHAGATGLVGSGIVLLAAAAKGRWMLLDFLKLRHTQPGWRALFFSWLLAVALAGWIAAAIPLFHG
jgi:hypothetical protein